MSFFVFTLIAQQYTNIESVEYDPGANRFFVSNGTSIVQRLSNGDLSFFGDARANYGMEVMNGTLFGIYNSTVRAYDLETAELLSSLSISGAQFLNGMASDPESDRIWITDFGNGEIHEIDASDPSDMSFATVADISGSPNGITYDAPNNRCLIAMWGASASIREMSLEDYSAGTVTSTGLANIDGIDGDGEGNFYISSWTPTRITKYSNNFNDAETITVIDGLDQPADICYAEAIDSLAIPNSGNETVVFVGFNTVGTSVLGNHKLDLKLFPNPANNWLEINFELTNSEEISLDIYDLKGKHVANLLNGRQINGLQRVIVPVNAYARGNYISLLRLGGSVYSARFTLH